MLKKIAAAFKRFAVRQLIIMAAIFACWYIYSYAKWNIIIMLASMTIISAVYLMVDDRPRSRKWLSKTVKVLFFFELLLLAIGDTISEYWKKFLTAVTQLT